MPVQLTKSAAKKLPLVKQIRSGNLTMDQARRATRRSTANANALNAAKAALKRPR